MLSVHIPHTFGVGVWASPWKWFFNYFTELNWIEPRTEVDRDWDGGMERRTVRRAVKWGTIKCIPFRGPACPPIPQKPHLAVRTSLWRASFGILLDLPFLFIHSTVCLVEKGRASGYGGSVDGWHPAVRQLTNQINSHQYRANPSKSVIAKAERRQWGARRSLKSNHLCHPSAASASTSTSFGGLCMGIFCVGSTPGCTLLISWPLPPPSLCVRNTI